MKTYLVRGLAFVAAVATAWMMVSGSVVRIEHKGHTPQSPAEGFFGFSFGSFRDGRGTAEHEYSEMIEGLAPRESSIWRRIAHGGRSGRDLAVAALILLLAACALGRRLSGPAALLLLIGAIVVTMAPFKLLDPVDMTKLASSESSLTFAPLLAMSAAWLAVITCVLGRIIPRGSA